MSIEVKNISWDLLFYFHFFRTNYFWSNYVLINFFQANCLHRNYFQTNYFLLKKLFPRKQVFLSKLFPNKILSDKIIPSKIHKDKIFPIRTNSFLRQYAVPLWWDSLRVELRLISFNVRHQHQQHQPLITKTFRESLTQVFSFHRIITH